MLLEIDTATVHVMLCLTNGGHLVPCLSRLPFAFWATCMSRRSLTKTVRACVDALRGSLAEIEADQGAEWELVDAVG